MKDFIWGIIKSIIKFLLIYLACKIIWFIHDKNNPDVDDSMNLLPVIAFGIAFICEQINELKGK